MQQREDTFCDLAYAPWPDLEARLRSEFMPLFALESRRSLSQFDVVGFSHGYELAYTNLLTMIDLAGCPLLAAQRTEDDLIFIAGGSCTLNPSVVGPFRMRRCWGDGEDAVLDLAQVVADGKKAGRSRAEILAQLRALPGAWHAERDHEQLGARARAGDQRPGRPIRCPALWCPSSSRYTTGWPWKSCGAVCAVAVFARRA